MAPANRIDAGVDEVITAGAYRSTLDTVRACLIVNPSATSTTPAGRDLLAYALASRLELTVEHTEARDHAQELAASARERGFELLIVHGGDGTVNEVINGMLGAPGSGEQHSALALAVVPGGSANVFARTLGVHADPVAATNQLIAWLDDGVRRRISLGVCNDRWFTFNAGLGLDARVCAAVEAHRRKGRAATPGQYVRSALVEFFREQHKPPALTVTLPGRHQVTDIAYTFISNSSPWTYLRERPVYTNPNSSFDRGLGMFAMATTKLVPTLRIARQLFAPSPGPHGAALLRVDDVPYAEVTADRPIALQLDGDYLGDVERARFRSEARALTVVAPPGPADGPPAGSQLPANPDAEPES